MRRRRRETFTTIKTEGNLLPIALLQRIAEGDRGLAGLSPDSYHLAKNERLNEVINRAWSRCEGAWRAFRPEAETLPQSDTGTTITREHWLLPLFQELGYGRLITSKAREIDGKTYPISHDWHDTPIHLVSFRQDLDRRTPGMAGAARMSPHSLVQEYLNRSDGMLWGIVSNGLKMRLLRDNASLTRQSYVEFDLEGMMSGEVYSDFVLLFMLLHESRVEAERPDQCWLERWSQEAQKQGVRALDQLRIGVERAIASLGQGFLENPANTLLRQKLQSGELTKDALYQQLLRLVYRMIFLFVAEDRNLLLEPGTSVETARLYMEHYSLNRIRRVAERLRGTQHTDLWKGLKVTFNCLAHGQKSLGLSPLGGFLFSPSALSDLNDCELSNEVLLTATRHLSFTMDNHSMRAVDYRNLGTEELGSVYESLLELHPQVNVNAYTFELKIAAGSERKTTGSYYTPSSLINCLLDSALEPVIGDRLKEVKQSANGKGRTTDHSLLAEKALLSLKVVDPACGSGHFLIAAAHRIAKHLAMIRTGESEPGPGESRKALRDVVSHCIYGVDINPLAVELCKLALWIETLDPGRPLGFLDHHVKCGNSLIGATPELLEKGIPDDAFKTVEGDDKEIAAAIRRKNREERKGQQNLFTAPPKDTGWEEAAQSFQAWGHMPENSYGQVCEKAAQYETLCGNQIYRHEKRVADLWTAAFFWPLTPDTAATVPTEDIFRRLQADCYAPDETTRRRLEELATKHLFFHWHLEFPEVFTHISSPSKTGVTGDSTANPLVEGASGFDCVLGNPPWERIKLQEKEFFAQKDPEIANAPNAAARKKLIARLVETNLPLYQAFQGELRRADCESGFVRDSGRYPLCGRGDVNTYSIFAELKRNLLNPIGRVGCIVPSGIATDDTTKFFFQDLIDRASLQSLYIFENERRLFPGIDHRNKFALVTMVGGNVHLTGMDFVFGAYDVSDLSQPIRHFTLTAEEINLLNPNTRTCPIFRSKCDAELTKYIYRRIPVLLRESETNAKDRNPWGIRFATMFHMANDSNLFRTREQLEDQGFVLRGNAFAQDEEVCLPLYEGKMLWHFDHRFGTYQGQTEAQANQSKLPELTPEQHGSPELLSLPRYWVAAEEVKARVPKRPQLLAEALKLPETWRKKAVFKTFAYWAAGYYRKAGDEAQAKKLLTVALPFTVTDSQVDVLNKWLLDARCERMQERYPLTRADVQRMTAFPPDPIPLAEELLERFSPHWFVAFRDVTNAVVLRTAVFSIIPEVAVGHKAPLAFTDHGPIETCCFLADMNSFALDYLARQSIGGTSMSYFILKQLPTLPPECYLATCPWETTTSLLSWAPQRVLELSYTSWDLDQLSKDLGCHWPPFCWDEDRRFFIRAELDAAFFHLYLGNKEEWEKGSKELLEYFPTPRHVVEYIMDSFRILRERDEAAHGTYRTKATILEIYDEMSHVMAENSAAIAAGRPPIAQYQTRLDPPPGPPIDAKGNFLSMYDLDLANLPSHIHPPHPAWEESLLSAWFRVYQKKREYIGGDQRFPWDGREAFVYALIPYLIQEKPGEKFEFYRDAALLTSRTHRIETLLVSAEQRTEYRRAIEGLDWLQFPESHGTRPKVIREKLQSKLIIQTDASSGATTVHSASRLPPLPKELKPMLRLILNAAENLDKMQRRTLEKAEAESITVTADVVENELKALMVA